MAAAVVADARFKLLDVTAKQSIRQFTTEHGLDFAKGKGFYELMKPELIQDYKEIVAVRISDGAKVTGTKVRELLDVPLSATKFKLDTNKLKDFKVFVQSTSYNRVLLPGTQFLYEVNDAVVVGADRTTTLTHERPSPPPSGAGMPIEIVFSFDTTGSMSSVLDNVRLRLQELIQRLQNDIPCIRIAVFAHGDYCDAASSYVTKFVDFSTDAEKLKNFVKNVAATGGGDFEECYELVLQEARNKLSWTPGTQRALIMIGDAIPHEPKDYAKDHHLKKFPRVVWKDEVDLIIRERGCRIYAVQCQDVPSAGYFWKYLAYHTHGYHLNLNNFSSVFDFIMAICYREQGPEQLQAYRTEVEERSKASGGMNAELHRLFEALGVSSAAPSAEMGPLITAAAPAEEAILVATAPVRAGGKRKGAVAAKTGGAKKPRASKISSKRDSSRALATKAVAKKVSTASAKGKKSAVAKKVSTPPTTSRKMKAVTPPTTSRKAKTVTTPAKTRKAKVVAPSATSRKAKVTTSPTTSRKSKVVTLLATSRKAKGVATVAAKRSIKKSADKAPVKKAAKKKITK